LRSSRTTLTSVVLARKIERGCSNDAKGGFGASHPGGVVVGASATVTR
jgi:hypothetical protein